MADSIDAEGMKRGRRFLLRKDPELGVWMKKIGPLDAPPRKPTQFVSLSRTLISQQISNRAAQTIIARSFALCEKTGHPRPKDWLSLSDAKLSSAGLSVQKISYLRALSEAFSSGALAKKRLSALPQEKLEGLLTEVRGIGLWTAQMFAIFDLRRPDVFSSGDLALRNGMARVRGLEKLTPRECDAWAERWSPWRSVASLYLWRIAHYREQQT
ncbi:MAG: DNA-3-methyladenine glycosylase 2 family protein [Planctomycetota bacterium]